MNPNGTDALFEIIRKELNTIIENDEKKSNESKDKKQSNTKNIGRKATDSISGSNQDVESILQTRNGEEMEKWDAIGVPIQRVKGGLDLDATSKDAIKNSSPSEGDASVLKSHTRTKLTLEKDIAQQAAYLGTPRSKSIDADLQRMQIELQDSYNLFQGLSEKFENINFNNLHKRIKELNLGKKRDIIGHQRSDELKEVVEEGFNTNRMSELTTEVGQKFNRHSGEFGNIPELSSFFQACTQLEHVLGTLGRQRSDVRELEERMRKSAEISYNRVNHIKKQLQERDFEKPAQRDMNDV